MTHASTQAYRVVNPATGALVEDFATETDAGIQDALAAAQDAYDSWSKEPEESRASVLLKVAELFEERAHELAAIITEEMGKRFSEAVGEAEFCGEIFRYFAEHGSDQSGDVSIPSPEGTTAVVQRRPIGPLLGIMPWNFPYYQVARFAAPNLMLGNTILLKPAESCPQSSRAVESLMIEAGVPLGVFTNVLASFAQIETMIADPRVQGVSLTGSERAGSIVAATAGRHLKRVVLELGGSDPYIVLDTRDVTGSADLAWDTRMENTGQACNSNKRIIVHEDHYEDFVARLVERASTVRPGDPSRDEPDTFGPMASRAAAEALQSQVRDSVDGGAVLLAGGAISDGPDAYFTPAVLTDVTPQTRAYREELFGPVLVVYKVASDAEALELANDSQFGLGGAVFSDDPQRALAVADELEVGMANVNIPMGEGAEIPFGGTKRSGYGRELGPFAMDEFANKRLLFINH